MFDNASDRVLDFIRRSPSCFHVVENLKNELLEHDYEELREEQSWNLKPGGRYFVTRNGSSILSFRLPALSEGEIRSAHIIASHSDSPTFKVKPSPEICVNADEIKLNIEKYGGMLCSTWFDRPLSVAGRVLVLVPGAEGRSSASGIEGSRDEEAAGGQAENSPAFRIEQRLVNIDRDLLMIPSLAIHMNRNANDGTAYNVQKDMLPLFSQNGDREGFRKLIADAAGVEEEKGEKILGEDLFLVNRTPQSVWGADREFISSPKLDDLECCYSSFLGFLDSGMEAGSGTGILGMHCVFDNEETGSRSKQGAESTFLRDTLDRIMDGLGLGREDCHRILANSFMVSADNAHAVHPNFPDKADPVLRPRMNQGIVIKNHANQLYTTDGVSEAIFRCLCEAHKIPCQGFVNRSDMRGGSTLGNISNTQVSMNTVDIGLAQLAMHSSYETAGARDPQYLAMFSKYFYEEKLPEIR